MLVTMNVTDELKLTIWHFGKHKTVEAIEIKKNSVVGAGENLSSGGSEIILYNSVMVHKPQFDCIIHF